MCKNAKILLIVSSLFAFSMGLSNIFVNIFFWRETKSFIIIALYNLIINITTPITFIVAGILSKKKNGIWSLRIGLATYAVFFVLILYIGNKGVAYIYLLGVISGIAAGFYWLPFNVLCCDFTSVSNRDTFNGLNGGFSGIASIIGPISAAYLISRFSGLKGYRIVFTMTCTIFVILILISSIFKGENYSDKIDYKKAFGNINEGWRVVRKSTFFWGFRDSVMMFLINILGIEVFKKELVLGEFALVAALITSASYVLVQKIIKPPHRKKAILFGTIGSFFSVMPLVININFYTLFMYAIIDSFCLPFFLIQLTSSTFNVIDRKQDEQSRIEYMINRDIVLNGGRAISVSILILLLVIFKNMSILKFYLIFLGIMPLIAGYILRKIKGVL
jgi:YQGE family putative transporter